MTAPTFLYPWSTKVIQPSIMSLCAATATGSCPLILAEQHAGRNGDGFAIDLQIGEVGNSTKTGDRYLHIHAQPRGGQGAWPHGSMAWFIHRMKGRIWGQLRHRCFIPASLAHLSRELRINPKSVAKWRQRTTVEDMKIGRTEAKGPAMVAGRRDQAQYRTARPKSGITFRIVPVGKV